MKILSGTLYAIKAIWEIDKRFIILNIIYSFENIPRRLLNILIIKYIVDAASEGKSFLTIALNGVAYLALEIAFIIIKHIFIYLYKQPKEEIIKLQLKRKMMMHSINCDLSCFDDEKFFNLYTRAYSSLDTVAFDVMNTLIALVGAILSVFTLAGYMLVVDPAIILISLIGSAISIFSNTLISKVTYAKRKDLTLPTRKCNYVQGKFFGRANAKELRVERLPDILMDLFNKSADEKEYITRKYGGKIAGLKVLFDAPLSVSDMFMWLYIAYGILKGVMRAGDFMSLSNATWSLSQQIRNVFNSIPKLYEYALYTNDVMMFDSYHTKVVSGVKEIPAQNHSLQFKNVDFEYQDDNPILKNVSFEVSTGQQIAIVGHNGAGKSTLVKLALRLYEPTAGECCLDGRPYGEYALMDLRSQFAVVFQDYQYYAVSIAENILMRKPQNSKEEEKVFDVLKKVKLFDKVNSFKNGIYTKVTKEFDEQGEEFSAGEYQKLAIARAIIKNSPIIIMDEPSSSLDPLMEKELSDIINENFSNKILIIISHKLSMTKDANTILVLDDGEIKECGKHCQLIKKNGLYAKMWHAQSQKYTGSVR